MSFRGMAIDSAHENLEHRLRKPCLYDSYLGGLVRLPAVDLLVDNRRARHTHTHTESEVSIRRKGHREIPL